MMLLVMMMVVMMLLVMMVVVVMVVMMMVVVMVMVVMMVVMMMVVMVVMMVHKEMTVLGAECDLSVIIRPVITINCHSIVTKQPEQPSNITSAHWKKLFSRRITWYIILSN